jgi:hypothetical protein
VPASGDRQPGLGGAGAFAGFAPWIVYAVVAKPSTWEWAALAALAVALILAVPAVRGDYPKLLDVGAIGLFAALATLGLLLDRADLAALERYSLSLSAGALALIVCATLPFVPYTAQYARATVPREEWADTWFKRTHVVLTAVWGATFALIAVICGYVEATGTPSDLLTWVVPAALVAGAFKCNQRYAERERPGLAANGGG